MPLTKEGTRVAQKVLAGMTMSLDGYVTGPDDRPGAGLGEGGERLMGGANLFGQYLGAGVFESPFATHLRYRLARERRSGGGIA
jgi:hypothetical protein